ncbi:DUF1707 SHOCT-like domain-containing protein [Amycolatopsis lurida]
MSDEANSDEVRASDADREATVKRLNDAFAEGRIQLAELDDRVQAAYAALTYRELHELESDLPSGREMSPHSDCPRLDVIGARSDPVSAYFNLRYKQLEWFRKIATRPPGQRGLAALVVGRTAVLLWLAVNATFLAVCLIAGVAADSPLYGLWPVVAAPWGAVVLTIEIFRRLDRY